MGKDDKRYLAGGPGIGTEAAHYLGKKGIVAAGADNWSFEAVPHENSALSFPVNQMMATEYGVQVLENILVDELVEDKFGNSFLYWVIHYMKALHKYK
ncbi:cyclase family protein [Dokdonia sp. Hel_I_63]|uniref:cyclase family protein n=1 Tax=Dokdonia sp. Hel_I_63 TaxID=1249996 RepID=UPI001C941BB0